MGYHFIEFLHIVFRLISSIAFRNSLLTFILNIFRKFRVSYRQFRRQGFLFMISKIYLLFSQQNMAHSLTSMEKKERPEKYQRTFAS